MSARLQEARLKWSLRGELPPCAARWSEQLLPERSAGRSSRRTGSFLIINRSTNLKIIQSQSEASADTSGFLIPPYSESVSFISMIRNVWSAEPEQAEVWTGSPAG